jgi:2-polyprenyl-3-methyl-5-hydroxy-6-metoxy-1,4-benzoquinol methylase
MNNADMQYMRKNAVTDRMQLIGDYIGTGVVLDIGCVDSRPSQGKTAERLRTRPNLLFRQIREVNSQLTGVDIDADGIEILRQSGYQVICDNAETMDLDQKFDVIVAGEVIEHLENPGAFLRNLREHLAPGGHLVITTPNPFYAKQTWKIWRHGQPSVHEDHTCWFDPLTLGQLLERTGFELIEGSWVQSKDSWFKVWKALLRRYFSHSFIVVASARMDSESGYA